MTEEQEREEGVRVNDRRLIDPETYEVRQSEDPAAAPGARVQPVAEGDLPGVEEVLADELAAVRAQAAEATADAKRIAAEYANYRKRVDRDREVQRQLTVGAVLTELLPVLDDIERARSHGELEGGFKSVGEAVEAVAVKLGLQSYGQAGEPFDPTVHEAMTSSPDPEVTEPTVAAVYQAGYRLGDRVLRPARVAVADTE